MPEFLNRISNQLTEFWNKYSTKQKIQMATTIAIGIIALVVLVVFLNRPKYELLQGDLEPSQVNVIVETLTASGINNQVGEDARSVYVEQGSTRDATLALAEIGILSGNELTYDDLFESSIMTTESERALKRKEFLKTSLANTIELIDGVEQAEVELVMPESERTILDDAKESKASILITTNEKLASGSVESIAKLVATGVDNLSLDNVTVIDSTGRLLFDGQTVTDSIGNISSRTEYEMQKELMVKSNVRSILLSAGEYDDAMVTVDLVIDFDELEQVTERHSTQDGSNTGIVVEDNTYAEESTNASTGGTPGTDANGVTDTMIADGNESTVTIEERNVVYTYDTEVATAVKAIGGVKYDDSTVSVSLTKYRIYDQVMLENQEDGILQGRTWEQFKYDITQQGRTKIEEVDEDIIEMIRMASNVDNVMVLAYEVPKFIDREAEESNMSDYLLIGIIVLMILLLGYAVYKGTEPVEIKEIEPELSVEEMLASTRQTSDLEAIEFDGKSEARVEIENFVDNNPDAVALLLRNWLNEDWE